MITDENIIELFFARSEQGIRELDTKYGKVCHNLSYHILVELISMVYGNQMMCTLW